MARYIDEEKLIVSLMEYSKGKKTIGQCVTDTPTEDVAPVIRSKWKNTATKIDKKYHRHSLICKNCLRSATYFVCGTEDWWCVELPRYCSFCGATMDMEGE